MVPLPEETPPGKNRLRTKPVEQAAIVSDEREMTALYRTINLLLPEQSQKVIQFISSQPGEGVSTVVREVAKTAALRLGRNVLILDAAHHNPSQHLNFNLKNPAVRDAQLQNIDTFRRVCYQTVNANLCIATFPNSADNFWLGDTRSVVTFLTDLKNKFDLILIDSSPGLTAAESVALSRHVDGVILVVEAERTKWFNAERLKEKIMSNGGNILGVVLNKRRYYIPRSIYNWLF